jgi:UDP-glucose 4-epimerase
VADPSVALERTEFVHADTRQSFLTKLIRQLRLDTVVHCAVLSNTGAAGRSVHETNVIGTMNVLAACSGAESPVERLVVRSSVAIYDPQPFDPSYLSEEMAGRRPPTTALGRDLVEMEQLVSEFGLRQRRSTVTVLRLAFLCGSGYRTALSDYFLLPRIPTFLGFDPRLQLLHPDDAVEALYRSAVADHAGTFNVAGEGVLLLTQAVGLTGRPRLPVLPWLGPAVGRLQLRAAGAELPAEVVAFLANGCVVDTSRLELEFGWLPGHATREVMMDLVRGVTRPEIEAVPLPEERELQAYLRRRERRRAGARA